MKQSADPTTDRVVALVPMRHHSQRVPGKNYRPILGKPLYMHILETLRACPEVAQIVVDTDSPIIWEGVEATFPEVRLIKRPEPLRGGEVPTNDVIRHDLSQTDAEFYLQTHCTNPLLRSQTVSQAVHAFFASRPEHDSLFSVTRYQKRLWDARTRPVNHDPRLLLRTQDLEPLFEENSCLYIFERSTFLKHNNRLGERPWMFEIEAIEAWDIDEEWDFLMAQSIMAHRGGGMKRPNLG